MEIIKDKSGQPQVLFLDKGGEKLDVGSKLSDFQIIRPLGKGHFGSVSLVKSFKTNKLYAMKEIQLNIYENDRQRDETLKEIKIMENLHHPHVITYFTSFRDNYSIYIITEYINGGSLLNLVEEKKKQDLYLEENKIWDLLVQCLSGLLYLHEVKKIIHRDIKPDNLLLSADGQLKISDFGLSSGDTYYHIAIKGPILFMSPEMAKRKGYNHKSDIYMLGLTFFYLASYQLYEEKKDNGKEIIIVPNKSAKIPNIYSKDLIDFIHKLLNENPALRPSSYEAYRDAFAIYAIKYLKTTCIGSLIECLNCVKELKFAFYSPSITNKLSQDEANKFIVTKSFKNVLNSLNPYDYNENYVKAELIKFRLILLSGKERFNSLGEVEISTFTDYLLTKLHMEFDTFQQKNNNRTFKPSQKNNNIDYTNEISVIREAIFDYQKKFQSIIADNFCFLTKTELTCEKCNAIVKYTSNLQLSCSFCPDRATLYLDKNEINVIDLFKHFQKKRLFIDEKIKCNKCNIGITNVNKVKTIYISPNTFIMLLFYDNTELLFKLYIDEKIDISQFVERKDVSKSKYYLVGVIFEKNENDNNKSYFSISRLPNNGNWILFNGSSFTNSSYNEINKEEPGKLPKILFYSYY